MPTETPDFSLQILHMYGESGTLAAQTAPNLAALVDKFNDNPNTVVIAEGDTFIPGPFLVGGADPALNLVSSVGKTALGRPDIAILNKLGTTVSALGNHEFDLGSSVLASAIKPDGSWGGALFPFITANLDFSADSNMKSIADASLGGTAGNIAGSQTTALNGKIAPYAIKTVSGQKIGFVGATTYDLLIKSSPTGTVPKDDGNPSTSDLQEVAAYIQAAVDQLKLLGVNKIIMVDQLDTIERNKLLAPLVTGIDVMVAGGGHERMGDATDTAASFNGHDANFVTGYPFVATDAAGDPTLIVTTDTEFTYLGRLNVDFDANGKVIVGNLDPTINGAYASTAATVEAVYNNGQTASQIIAGSTMASDVKAIVDAINNVVQTKDSNVFGYTNTYLEGDRVYGRAQEVNLGNITADANLWKAKVALGLGASAPVVSLKNGGGLRASVGSVDEDGTKIGPLAVDGVKQAGAISQLDIENALRFDNKLMVYDTTAQGLLNILNFSAGLPAGNGGYNQLGGVAYSFDPTMPSGSKVRDVSLLDLDGNVIQQIVKNGVVLPNVPATITMVALNFTANGGDGYPIKANADNFRYLMTDGTLSAAVNESLDFTLAASMPGGNAANVLGEQKAFQDFLSAFHDTPYLAYDQQDTPANLDMRIENLSTQAGMFSKVTFAGTSGDDAKAGSLLADKMAGGNGNDLLLGFAGNDKISGDRGADTIDGGAGNDDISGGRDNDYLHGGTGRDVISGDDGDDKLFGDDGDDRLDGGKGNDTVNGGFGADQLRGGDGDDLIIGGPGRDELTGGKGSDTFAFGAPTAGEMDKITDFAKGDKIGLFAAEFGLVAGDALPANYFAFGSAATTSDQHLIWNKATKILSYDADGVGGDAAIAIARIEGAQFSVQDIVLL